jgi:ATP-dependent DNA helicase RecG
MPRNPLIANCLYLTKDIEKWGSGLKRIYEECKNSNVKVKFKIKKSGFSVVFYRRTDAELYELTGDNQENAQVNAQVNPENAQVNAQDNKNSIRKVTEDNILKFCKEPKSLKEIIGYFGYKNARGFREKYITPLINENKIKQTIPDKPQSRNQKYVTV